MNPTDRIPVEEGQHYEHTRGQIYTVDYMNGDIVLLYDGGNYRLEREDYFEKQVESGMFELRPELEISGSQTKIPFEEIDWVGEQAIDSLEKGGITTPEDFDYITDERLAELDSVGEKSVENIREWIDENVTETVEL